MNKHPVVDQKEWLEQRKQLLAKEKTFTKLREELSATRRALPWALVDKDYVFKSAAGQQNLGELFGDSRQLLIYHFMYGPDWEAGCPSCSFVADGMDNNTAHLKQRDIRLLLVGHAPLDKLQAYGQRMDWGLEWASSYGSDFNADFNVSFTSKALEQGQVAYNYEVGAFPSTEAPGISVFIRDDDGRIYHTYSTYARGLDQVIAGYNLIDLTPVGRNEAELAFTMAWLKRRDEY